MKVKTTENRCYSPNIIGTEQKKQRTGKGSFLVEAMVAILVASLLSAGLGLMFAQLRRVGNMTQGDLYATAVAMECIDQVRQMNFSLVNANQGIHYANLNADGADVVFPRALMKDPALDYTAGGNALASQGSNFTFHAINPDTNQYDDSVKVVIANGGISNSIRVSVTIRYLDTSGAARTFSTSSLITQYGLNS